MGWFDLRRIAPALTGGAAAGAATCALGAPLIALLPATFVGGLAAWLATAEQTVRSDIRTESDDPFENGRPLLLKLIEAFSDPLLLVERQQVTMANAAARSLLGGHIVGEDVRLAIRHPAAAERLTGKASGNTGNQPIQLVGIGEADRHWELTVHDVGTQRHLVRLSDRTSNYVAEKMRVDFVANASHELRTPLATLIGFIETLEDGKAAEDRPTRERFLGIMADEARRMQRLIDDLISLSRIEADKFSQPDRPITLAPLIKDVARAATAGIENDGKDRVLVAPVAPDLRVLGDFAQVSQLLHNLIGNALKYGRHDTPVRVSATRTDGGMVLIAVADQGEGISIEHLPRLTERFYRIDPSRSRAMGGTGLGLAIVKHIIERHRGRLDIRSEIGVGTTVSVLLPAAPEGVS
jgi:two-component system phosphate regulon sensor histidine kinase PhoR